MPVAKIVVDPTHAVGLVNLACSAPSLSTSAGASTTGSMSLGILPRTGTDSGPT